MRDTDLVTKLEALYEAQKLLRWLEPIAMGALLLEAWAVIEVFDVGRGHLAAVLSAGVATWALIWAIRVRRRLNALSDELGVYFDG